MDSEQVKRRRNVEGDRLSSLPDELIHKILSFIVLKHAIKTSALSSRWRYIWTSMPYLDFSSEDFSTLPKFSKFVTHVLSRRNNIVQVFSVKLSFRGKVSQGFVKRIIKYASSHNVQQLDVACLLENEIEFPLSLLTSSQSLKHLSLKREFVFRSRGKYVLTSPLTVTSTLELPSLTTLYLNDVSLCCDDGKTDKCIDLFSKCANLKNLTLKTCEIKGSDCLSICHPLLSNLTLDNVHGSLDLVDVVTPQLKNLTICDPTHEHEYIIDAPKLASLLYKGYHPLDLWTDGFDSLEKMDLCISNGNVADVNVIVNLFEKLGSVKFLTLNLEIVELLSSYWELISNHSSPFTNLKMLKIYPANVDSEEKEQKKIKMSTEVKNFLLYSSPGVTFTMVSREEIRAIKNTKLVQKLMAELRVLLEQEKDKTETNKACMERGKAPMGNHINNCWADLSVQILQEREKTFNIISKLQNIKEILTKLPTSKRAEMQECFSSLCAEADTLVNKIIDHMNLLCNMKRSRFSMYFHELALTSQSSS